jgi:rare lipoprotein A
LKRVLTATLVAGFVVSGVGGPGATAQTIEDRLAQAKAERAEAVLTVQALRGSITMLGAERARVSAALDRAAARLIAAYAEELRASTRLTLAVERLDERARDAYQMGPSAALGFLFSVDSPDDMVDAQEFAESAMSADVNVIQEVQLARAEVAANRGVVEQRKAELSGQERELDAILSTMEDQLADAERAARKANVLVGDLEAERAAIEAARRAAADAGSFDLDPSGGVDQSALLALLGPTGGRSCTIPEGLEDTGADVVGDASWYGWDFAGQHTASGAIFDPRLFTAAHRDLPLGSFLRVRWNDRCVIVLVNDRGPYGNYDRVIDLSLGAASYLGTEHIGVAPVVADILVPKE